MRQQCLRVFESEKVEDLVLLIFTFEKVEVFFPALISDYIWLGKSEKLC